MSLFTLHQGVAEDQLGKCIQPMITTIKVSTKYSVLILGQRNYCNLRTLKICKCLQGGIFSGSEGCCSFLGQVYSCQGKWPQLTSLNICTNSIGLRAVEQLIKGDWPLLKNLDIGGNQLSSKAIAKLAVSLGLCHILWGLIGC